MKRPIPFFCLLTLLCGSTRAETPTPRVADPKSPLMLAGDWMPDDPHQIDYESLPRVPSEHVVIHSVREQQGVNQHNYLAHHDGRFWAMWSDGRYVLIGNSNPRQRDPLTLALSDDGLVFTRLARLVGGRRVDYPHAIEHNGYLFVAFAGGKQSVELLRISLDALDRIEMPATAALNEPLPPIR